MKLNQNRSQLRGKELDEDCHGAVTSTNEFGINDNKIFCFGINDSSTESLIEKCINCRAHVSNVELLESEEE